MPRDAANFWAGVLGVQKAHINHGEALQEPVDGRVLGCTESCHTIKETASERFRNALATATITFCDRGAPP